MSTRHPLLLAALLVLTPCAVLAAPPVEVQPVEVPPLAGGDAEKQAADGDGEMQAPGGEMEMQAPEAMAAHAPAEPLTREQSDFFESKVRPVLATCYKCHSVEEKKAKGDLVLDSREGWRAGGTHGPAVVPGDPANSLLLKAVRYEDPDLRMPPNGDKLSDEQIAALEQWVKMGAPDPRAAPAGGASKLTGLTDAARAHWAFQPVRKPAVPQPQDAGWVKTPVDAFVLQKLDQNAMAPARPASREALIRRASYDLTGLPPTPEEVEAFVDDASPDAFAKVVDRLLASPHYGERWGRLWLDTARYADTTGAEDQRADYRYPYAWTYRDYVIDSFNTDKPYDEFLTDQIAADLLPETQDEPERLAALGFLTVGKRFANPNDTIDERIDTLTKATQGLTVACARCHDHKFDPVPTADYYSLHGIFASTLEPPDRPLVGAPPEAEALAAFERELADLERKNRDIYFDYVEQTSAEFREKAGAYLLANAYRGRADAAQLEERNRLIREYKLDRDLSRYGLRVDRRDDAVFGPMALFLAVPKDDFAARAAGVLDEIARGGPNPKRRPFNPLVVKAFAGASPDSLRGLADVAAVYGRLFDEIDGRAREYVRACRTATSSRIDGYDPALVQLIETPAKVRPAILLNSQGMREAILGLPLRNNGYGRFLFDPINQLLLTDPGSPARAMAVADAPKPKNSPIFIRGERQNRGPIAPRQYLEIVSGSDRTPFTQGSGRLELARAIASASNPLTARALVNRVWMHHFGDGFVRTPDDLGVQSEPPSHPELLDYLAARFVEDASADAGPDSEGMGWSVKRLHRLVMNSAVYQQSSDTNAEYAQKDPENRLMWRANVRRLDFEAVRDSMVMFTGKLDRTLGGQPVNLTDEPYSNRRSVYGYIDRGELPELMSQFDFSDPDMANSRRRTTVVPQQGLFFMNSPMAVDVARKVTSRPEFTGAADPAGRVTALYGVLFQRPARPEEVEFALEFVAAAEAAAAAPQPAAPAAPAVDDDAANKAAESDRPMTEKQKRAARRAAKQKAAREQDKAVRQAKRKAEREKRLAEEVKRRNKANGRAAIRNEGEVVERKPLTPWEQYAQALLFSNELVYVN